jgi:hypothetical protein
LTSLLPSQTQKTVRLEKQEFILRLKVDVPQVEMYKTSSYTQFNQAGFGPGDGLIAKEDAWSEPALPKFKHCWPTFSSRTKF